MGGGWLVSVACGPCGGERSAAPAGHSPAPARPLVCAPWRALTYSDPQSFCPVVPSAAQRPPTTMPMFTKLAHKTSTAAKSSGQSAAKTAAAAAAAKGSVTGAAGKHFLDNTRWQVCCGNASRYC